LECPKKWAPSSEQSEKAEQAPPLSVQSLSEDEDNIEEVVAPTGKKRREPKAPKEKKPTKAEKQKNGSGSKRTKGSSSKETISSPENLASSPRLDRLPSRQSDVVTVAGSGSCPTELNVVSNNIYAPSQI
jgi:hypothetical protein